MKDNPDQIKLVLSNFQAPGDLLMLSAAVRDLHISHPGKYLTDVRCSCPEIFMYNPYISSIIDRKADFRIDMEYPLHRTVTDSHKCSLHFVHAFRKYLEAQLNIQIHQTELRGEVYLTEEEKQPLLKDIDYYWILNAGWKDDFPVKRWSPNSFRKVVDAFPDITFVQIGSHQHHHPTIDAPNVINMVGKTSIRKFLQLMYHASGVLTGVSFPMHACAAVKVPDDREYNSRPCIIPAGGRECTVWEQYNTHTMISRVGMMECCLNGGCDRKLFSTGEDSCKNPVQEDIVIAECMSDIHPEEIINYLEKYIKCQKSL